MIPDEFRRGWGALLACFTGAGTGCLVLTTYSIGVFVRPMAEATTWSRQDILLSSSFLTGGILGTSFLVGWLSDRYPVRNIIMVSQLGLSASLFTIGAFVEEKWAFYTVYAVMALVAAGTLPITFARALSTRFDRHRGLAIGIALAGTGLSSILLPPGVSYFVENYGWRAGYFCLSAIPIALALPTTFCFLRTDAVLIKASGGNAVLIPRTGVTLLQALQDRRFWILAAGSLLGAAASNGLVANLIPLMRDHASSAVRANIVMSIFGAAVIGGRIGIGFLMDRVWAPPIGLALMAPAGLATICLSRSIGTFGVICALVILIGFAAGAEFDLVTYLVARYFGVRSFGRIYACIYVAFSSAIGIAPPLFGRAHDMTGSYDAALYCAGAAWITAGCLLATLGPYVYHRPVPVESLQS